MAKLPLTRLACIPVGNGIIGNILSAMILMMNIMWITYM